MGQSKVAKVIFPIAIDKEFDYLLPPQVTVQKGMRLLVEFGGRKRVGLITRCVGRSSYANLKPVMRVLDTSYTLRAEQLLFAKRLSKRYLYSFGEMAFSMIPAYLKGPKILETVPVIQSPDVEHSSVTLINHDNFKDRFIQYKDVIAQTLLKHSVMLLFPSVSCIDNALSTIDRAFAQDKIIIHSYKSDRDNCNSFKEIRSGKKIIVGTRMAVFYYPHDLGLIVVEEENSSSYFQPEKPYYYLLDVVFDLCAVKKVPLILSSDYPSLATFKAYGEQCAALSRVQSEKRIEVFDLNTLYSRKNLVFSPFLIELMRKDLEEGKNILIAWTRRNYSRILRCDACSFVYQCPRCTSFLQYSMSTDTALCASCGYKKVMPKFCESCHKGYVKPIGLGVERIERIIKKIFPDFSAANASCADRTTRIILGTVGVLDVRYKGVFKVWSIFVLDIDTLLSQIDYEATFNAFLYLKKLESLSERNLYVFTHNPRHYLWSYIGKGLGSFYRKELTLRKELMLPPYGAIAKITLRSSNKLGLLKKANSLYNRIEEQGLSVFGPLEEVPFKLRDKYRYTIVVKAKKRSQLLKKLEGIVKEFRKQAYRLAIVIR